MARSSERGEGAATRCGPFRIVRLALQVGDLRRVLARGVEDGLDLGVVEVVPGDEGGARIYVLELALAADGLDGGVDAVVAHAERILGYKRGNDALLDGLDLVGGGIPAHYCNVVLFAGATDGFGGPEDGGLVVCRHHGDLLRLRVGAGVYVDNGEALV